MANYFRAKWNGWCSLGDHDFTIGDWVTYTEDSLVCKECQQREEEED